MKVKCLYYLFLIFITSCFTRKNNTIEYYDSFIKFKVLSKELKIPKADSIKFSDTLEIELYNNSNKTLVFIYNEKNAYFCSPDSYEDPITHVQSDPLDGLLLTFFNENMFRLEPKCITGFEPDLPEDIYHEKWIKKVNSKSTIKLNLIVSFPSKVSISDSQYLSSLSSARFVGFFFEPDVSLLNLILKENNIKLKENEMPMKIRKWIDPIPVTIVYQ